MKKGESKGRGRREIHIHLSNRWLYTFIALGILVVIGAGVYAATYTSSGAGHPYTEISTCGANQILKMNSAGTAWTCSDVAAGAETDPQVGAVTNGGWCAGDGIAVQCNKNEPPYITTVSVIGNPHMTCDEMCAPSLCVAAINAESGGTVNCGSRPVDNWFCTGCDSETVYCICG